MHPPPPPPPPPPAATLLTSPPPCVQTNNILFKRMAKQAWERYMTDTGRTFAKMTFTQDEAEIGTLMIEIFTDHCPKTSAQFIGYLTARREHGELAYEVSHGRGDGVQAELPVDGVPLCSSLVCDVLHGCRDARCTVWSREGGCSQGDVVDGAGDGDPGNTFPDETFKVSVRPVVLWPFTIA